MKLDEIYGGRRISFADPDREPGAVEREGKARQGAAQRQEVSNDAMEDVAEKLGGKSSRVPYAHSGEKDEFVKITGLRWGKGTASLGMDPFTKKIAMFIGNSPLPWGSAPGYSDVKAIVLREAKKCGLSIYGTDLSSTHGKKVDWINLGWSITPEQVDGVVKFVKFVLEYCDEF
jgi:hypothetical protein